MARTTKSTKRAVAGPSKPAVKGKRKNAKKSPVSSDAEDAGSRNLVEIISADDDGEDELESDTPLGKGERKKATAKSVKGVNKGKGKANEKNSRIVASTVELVDAEDIELVDDTDAEAAALHTAQALNSAWKNNKLGTSTTRQSKSASTSKELDRLRQRLIDVRCTLHVSYATYH